MSRIRSQLDTILATGNEMQNSGARRQEPAYQDPMPAFAPRRDMDSDMRQQPHNAYAPAPQQPPQVQSNKAELDALHQSLVQLSRKIASIPQPAPQPSIQQELDKFARISGDHSNQLAQMGQTVVTEIRDAFGQVRHDLSQTGQQVSASVANSVTGAVTNAVNSAFDNTLSSDLQRISQGISMLQEDRQMHPDYIDEMKSELGNLSRGIDKLLNRPVSQVDLSGVSRAIDNNYSELVNKLENALAQRGNELPEIKIPDYSGELSKIHHRLEEVTRAVVSLTVSPGNTSENHSFERIEARLASLSKSVDDILHAATTNQQDQTQADFGETISAQISRLSEKLDNLDAMGAAGDALGSEIFPDVQEIAKRIDSLQNDFGILAANLDQAMQQVAQQSQDEGNAYAEEAFSAIEEKIGELATRFEHFAARPNESTNSDGQEILGVLREVVERIDALERQPAPAPAASIAGFDDDRFSALENQLAGITAQLGSFSAPAALETDLSPITERLDHIEGQIATSRDIVIEIATDAARKAIGTGTAGEMSNEAVETILEELRQMRAEQEISRDQGYQAQPDSAQFEEIGSTMAAIAERLAGIEESVRMAAEAPAQFAAQQEYQPAVSRPAMPEMSPYAAQPVTQPVSQPVHEPDLDLDLPDARQATMSQSGIETAERTAEMGAPYSDEDELVSVDNAPSMDIGNDDYNDGYNGDLDMGADDQPQAADTTAEVEDVPLAPGSGMPDLEALVKRATNRKKGLPEDEEPEPKEEGITDLMAAARRAAQAASVQANAAREMPEKKASKLKGKIPSLDKGKLPGFVNKKNLMMSAAVIAIAVGGLVLAPKFFGSADAPVSNASTSETPAAGAMNEGTDTVRQIDDGDSDDLALGEGEVGSAASSGSNLLSPEGAGGTSITPADSEETLTENGGLSEEPQEASIDTTPEASLPSEELGNLAFRQAVATGDGDALFEAGKRYTDGQLVPRDLKEAVSWYTKAAEAGHAPAQYRLGNFFEKGHGVEADPAKAAEWYSAAADQGNALAMHNLAVLNAMGVVNGDADMEVAIKWFERAANLGVKDSQVNLGILYTKGMGVQEDLEKAYKWFAIAAKGGDSDAGKKRDTVAQAMRPEQLEAARGAAEIWKPGQLDAKANVSTVKPEWVSTGAQKAMSKAEMVRMTQTLLTKAGFDAGPADGMMGEKTRQAIIAFQEANGLNPDGNVSEELMDALQKISI